MTTAGGESISLNLLASEGILADHRNKSRKATPLKHSYQAVQALSGLVILPQSSSSVELAGALGAPSTLIFWCCLGGASARSSSSNAPRPGRRHHLWNGFRVPRINCLRHCGDAPPQRGARPHLAGNLECDVRRHAADSIACCPSRVAALVSGQRPVREHHHGVSDFGCRFTLLAGTQPRQIALLS